MRAYVTITRENHREELLNSVRAALKQQRPVVAGKKLAATFVDLFFARVATDELEQRDPADLAALAAAMLDFGWKRQPGVAKVRAYNPAMDTHGWEARSTIVEIVNDDMPFLVDSVSMAVAEHHCTVHLTIHPTLDVVRDGDGNITDIGPRGNGRDVLTESFVYMEIDRQNSRHALRRIRKSVEEALADVRAAVDDWSEMRDKALAVSQEIGVTRADVDDEWLSETRDFVDWMARDHFTFLGYKQYDLRDKDGELWLYPDDATGLGLLNSKRSGGKEGRKISGEAQELVDNPELIVFTKTNARATVHRTGYMDYVGVMRFDGHGRIIGEHRFLGQFTSGVYSRAPRDIPLLRLKVRNVLQRSGLSRGGHGGKALMHILDTLPRDELFQGSEEEIYTLAMGILNLQERRQTRLFIRKGRFGRFFSCLVYIPRDRFNTEVRENIQGILRRALKGVRLDYTVQVFDTPLARVHVFVRTRPGEDVVDYNVVEIEQRLVEAVRSWQDQLEEILVGKVGEGKGLELARRFGQAFPAAYTEDVGPWVASFDVLNLAAVKDEDDLGMSLYRPRKRRGSGMLRFKVFRYHHTIPLSDAVPMLENMGLRIVSERPYELNPADGRTMWIQDFDMIPGSQIELKLDQVRDIFQETFLRVWRGEAENDGFNRLVLSARLDWRQVSLIRAVCKYLLQTGLPFSQPYMEQTLADYPVIARLLVELFEARFDPRFRKRDEAAGVLEHCLHEELEEVRSLDADRILRSFIGVIKAALRTNYYQVTADGEPKPAIAFKLDSSKVPELPEPRPMFEIFVYAPHMEGVHLRGGEVARGGLRWSDRREDFRTEVLGLMKAQMVKNTVIVPVGAKGGFVLKRAPDTSDRDAVLAEGVRCYRHFVSSLLDITDNIVDGDIVPPPDVVRYDGDDPYLVVAADKGTATFSDIANDVAESYQFWLGDAFASGGSVGYDHKKMGITARGAWESVKRHFREMGRDIQRESFDVVGIGDMSGDVFGNGMLLSDHIRLKAAFNHLHIFIDPDPDPAASYAERDRLFELPRSGWADYDAKLISKGGGVWSRQEKSIPLSPELRDWLGVAEERLAPNELIRALLKAPADLLWNGGIGTYVKARSESQSDAGDRSNDGVRVNGRDLRCLVVGEGGNLGFTQRGRIEYALNGGRLNTDFIDNSAGVNCSDHEVNIKILLNDAVRAGRLMQKSRPRLMASMTDEVAGLVLRSNYLQTQAISMMEAQATARLGEHGDFITLLEHRNVL
ncbi:MAG: NAD-glutamate dehydrogenase, partial [Gammaproteobacteria bacterium]